MISMLSSLFFSFFFGMNNKNFTEKGKALIHVKYTREPRLYLLLQSRKQIRSTKFLEGKLGPYTIAQSRSDLIKEDSKRSTLMISML
jgi:hypothetical protein